MPLRSTAAWVAALALVAPACVLGDFGPRPSASADTNPEADVAGSTDVGGPPDVIGSPDATAPDAEVESLADVAGLDVLDVLDVESVAPPTDVAGLDVEDDLPPRTGDPPVTDLDLDGLPDSDDPCPAVWSPDGDGSVCPAADPGAPNTLTGHLLPVAERRVRAVVELPLVAGWLDDRWRALWRFDGDALNDAGDEPLDAVGLTFVDGVFGDPLGAASFDGASHLRTAVGWSAAPPYSVFAWVWVDPAGDGGTVLNTNGAFTLQLRVADGAVSFGVDGSTLGGAPAGGWSSGWHHVAVVVWDEGGSAPDGRMVLVDGEVVAADDTIVAWGDAVDVVSLGAAVDVEGTPSDHFEGALDEVVVFSRVHSVEDVAAYVAARRPYGAHLAPGALPSFDDVEVVVTLPGEVVPRRVPAELVGARPRSSSLCPDDAPTHTFAARDDKCGVVGEWSLDEFGAAARVGRFGEVDGAVAPESADIPLGVISAPGSVTWELWVRPEPCLGPGFEVVLLRAGSADDAVDLLRLEQACALSVPALEPDPVLTESWQRSDQWLHVALVSDADAEVTTLWVDGARERTIPGALPPISGTLTLPQQGLAVLDELVVHGVAKSPAYVRRRGESVVPRLRWLASTVALPEADAYPWLDYEVRWGDASATHRVPLLHDASGAAHVGLLSPATGLEAWWRASPNRPLVMRDHAALAADAVTEVALPGPAGGVRFPSYAEPAQASITPWPAGADGTLEVRWRHQGTGGFGALAAQGPSGAEC